MAPSGSDVIRASGHLQLRSGWGSVAAELFEPGARELMWGVRHYSYEEALSDTRREGVSRDRGRTVFGAPVRANPASFNIGAAAEAGQRCAGFTDPDVPEPVVALTGTDLFFVSGPAPAGPVAGNGDAAGGGKCAGTRSAARPR